jgi:hypothetical protein
MFGDDGVAAAVIYRLVHYAEVISLKGDSYRPEEPPLGRVREAPGTRPTIDSRVVYVH